MFSLIYLVPILIFCVASVLFLSLIETDNNKSIIKESATEGLKKTRKKATQLRDIALLHLGLVNKDLQDSLYSIEVSLSRWGQLIENHELGRCTINTFKRGVDKIEKNIEGDIEQTAQQLQTVVLKAEVFGVESEERKMNACKTLGNL